MGYKLCMAEKPSVAKDIAKVIGANKSCNGYYEGNGYRVTWAVGHLVGLAEPEEYGFVYQKDMWKEKRDEAYAELPLIPEQFKLVVLEPTKAQFEIVKRLINSPETDEIINCGDMGPEGHILQWFIREKAGCKKRVRRFCLTDMTDEAILDAMRNLRPEEEFANIIRGEFCKKKADWIMGMSMSRVESLKYNADVRVGRVQSPTLWFVVRRFLEIKNFKVINYFGMDAELYPGFHVYWNKDTQNIFPASVKDRENRVLDQAAVDAKRKEIAQAGRGVVIEAEKKGQRNDRPQLFDITELQREANRKYGYTAAVTLATAQALYETQKVLSYPRTDSRYITSNLEPYMEERIKAIGTIDKYASAVKKLLSDGLNIDKKIVDDKKVTDHHALIPTEKIEGFDVSKMEPTKEEKSKGVTAESMRNILDLVLCRMIVSFSQPYLYEKTTIKVQFPNGMIFSASGTRPVKLGWKEVQERLSGKEEQEGDGEDEGNQTFPELEKGQTLSIKRCSVVSKKTTPPKLHTEATLLTAMENAGAEVAGGAILKGKGIGTQATRAEIIKKLFDTGYCTTEKKGKVNYIVPTAKGLKVIKVLPPELYSPQITADWENKIALIADGKMTEKAFMDDFVSFIHEKVQQVKEMDTGITFERESVGKCPWCNAALHRFEGKDAKSGKVVRYYCSNKGTCSFSLSTDNATITVRTGKKLTEKELSKLIQDGYIDLSCKSTFQGGSSYKSRFTIIKKEGKDGKIYTNVEAKTLPKKPQKGRRTS